MHTTGKNKWLTKTYLKFFLLFSEYLVDTEIQRQRVHIDNVTEFQYTQILVSSMNSVILNAIIKLAHNLAHRANYLDWSQHVLNIQYVKLSIMKLQHHITSRICSACLLISYSFDYFPTVTVHVSVLISFFLSFTLLISHLLIRLWGLNWHRCSRKMNVTSK